ncbi:hypothetical protein [Nonomuraea sp. NPDC049480]|uniref:hypothetical protein n=1 Tax=Nonomuraea sp. NPDC049480 TaxID=3364353 RepID=UPI0037B96501
MNRLAEQIMGPVLAPRYEEYDEERAGYQTARRHRPDLVVGAVGPADVQAAVTYAGSRGLPVAVQGTGHASAAVVSRLVHTVRARGSHAGTRGGSAAPHHRRT